MLFFPVRAKIRRTMGSTRGRAVPDAGGSGRRTIDDLLRDARSRLERLSPEEALAAARRDGLIVDIRSERQRAEQGLVPGAHFVPRNVLEWRADPSSAHRDERLCGVRGALVLMCAQGYQSSLAAATLRELGVAGATDMIGGFEGWRAAGLPVVADLPAHWERVFAERAPEEVSWFEPEPRVSLEMIDALGVGAAAAVIDVGGGASRLAAALAARGYSDVTVLDLSERALAAAGEQAAPGVRWLGADVLEWTPARAYDLWHDRALFHFLTEPEARRRYVAVARAAVRPGGHLVVGTFAEDGPERCSGLPVARYDARSLAAEFGDAFAPVEERRDEHRTPRGTIQPFTWVGLRRAGGEETPGSGATARRPPPALQMRGRGVDRPGPPV
jgi:rhodanese-related sulfurtransferase/2-polyprenyl-3-methyl-5-hydroxy-6-metoxy-1,4-benzoquinol methylase